MENMRKLTVPASKDQISIISEFILDLMANSGFDLQKVFEVQLAVEEACTNIAMYAYPKGDGDISIEAKVDDNRMELVIADRGKPFDPIAKITSISDADVENRPIGGLGIALIKSSVDKLCYEHKDGKNMLKLVKNKM